jgi:hypothetical protein
VEWRVLVPSRTILRCAVAVSMAVGGLAGAATHAQAARLCRFDPDLGRVHVSLPPRAEVDPVTIARSGDAIVVDGVPCGAARVSTTDSIVVAPDAGDPDAARMLRIDLGGGPFAPGRTPEPDKTPEIEMRVDMGPALGDIIELLGSDGADLIRVEGADVSLDDDEDVDLRTLGMDDAGRPVFNLIADRLHIAGGGGGDTIEVDRTRPIAVQHTIVYAGGGDDEVLLHEVAIDPPGLDDLHTFARGNAGDDRLVNVGDATGSLLGNGGDDLLIGGRSHDVLYGGAGDDVLLGRDSGDQLRAGRGNDLLWGGLQQDALLGSRGVDRCEVDPDDWMIVGCDGPPLMSRP